MPITHCVRCGNKLPEGHYVACGPCGDEYAAKAVKVNLNPPGVYVEPPYRRVAGAKVLLDDLPDRQDVS